MIATCVKPASSSASRMRPTRPSIMSDGATMSAPAAACDSAARDELLDGRVVGDLLVDEDAAVAVRRVLAQADVGDDQQVRDLALDRAHRATAPAPPDRRPPDPTASLSSGRPNSSTPGTPSAFAAAASFTASSTDSWNTPGIDADFAPLPFAGARRTADRGTCRATAASRAPARGSRPMRRSRRGRWRRSELRRCRLPAA